jgi:hypothetical protein
MLDADIGRIAKGLVRILQKHRKSWRSWGKPPRSGKIAAWMYI